MLLPVARHLLSSCSLLADSAAKELIWWRVTVMVLQRDGHGVTE
jgi:hypothetical protein